MLHRAFFSPWRTRVCLLALLVLLAGPAWAADIITTFAGDGTWEYGGDGGPAGQAKLRTPSGVTVDSQGNVYIADSYNHRIRKVSPTGNISTVAGTGLPGFSGDSGPATQARLNAPTGVAVDGAGNLYVADSWNGVVRKITASGIISTLNLNLVYPIGVAADGNGNVYVADYGTFQVHKYANSGQSLLVAGSGQSAYGGDNGPATQAGLTPTALTLDAQGNLYIADTVNHRIRQVKPDGTIVTFAGNGADGYSGDGGPARQARLSGPVGLAWHDNALYVADRGNHRIRRIDGNGLIATLAGNGTSGPGGDGSTATEAELSYPNGVALNSSGKLYIADTNNYRIRTLQPAGSAGSQVLQVLKTGTGSGTVSVPPGSGSGIQCGALCAENYISSTLVTLTAQPAPGSEFTGWAGDCSGTAASFNLVMNGTKTCIANFDLVGGDQHTLSLSKNSGGRVISVPSGIDCGVTCAAPFAHNDTVTLTALPESGFKFSQWGGACSGVSASTNVVMSSAKLCSASFAPLGTGAQILNVTRVGNGSVTSSPEGIDCGQACSAGFDQGTLVTLVATPAADSRFIGWSGDCEDTLNPTSVPMDTAKTCTANFELLAPGLGKTLSVSDLGEGFISSTPTGIDCGSTCLTQFLAGTAITLTATPGADQRFVGWSGDCSGNLPSLSFSLDNDRMCAANYETLPPGTLYPLSANVTGSGKVVSQDGALDCGTRCNAEYAANATVLLNATAAAGWTFAGWSGDCAGSNQPASLSMNGPKVCTANFTQGDGTVALTLAKSGSGTGTVSGGGLNCGPSCSGGFALATPVTLSVSPDVNSSFVGWSGDCSGNAVSIDLLLTASKTCVAHFELTGLPADSGIINTHAGTGIPGHGGDNGPALEAQLNSPWSVAETGGTLFVADRDNHVLRRISGGLISTVAGQSGSPGFGGDGGDAALASLNNPSGVAAGQNGKLYLADTWNHRIRVLDAYGNSATVGDAYANPGTVTDDLANATTLRIDTVAGNGILGFLGDHGPALEASLNYPLSATADSLGNVYIADTGNHRIRKVAGDGLISTVAGDGTPGFGGDHGPALQASLFAPAGLALSANGKLYIADQANYRVRVLDLASGIIDTYAGDGTPAGSGTPGGDGGPARQAQLNQPYALALDRQGNLYIAESNGQRVRKVDGNGVITTVAGMGMAGFSGDGGPAVEAQLNFPTGVAVDATSALFIADKGNHRIRRVGGGGGAAQSHRLSIAKIGTGTGTVASTTPGETGGIDCGTRCSDIYPHNAQVTLVATPGADTVFGGWSGACTGTGSRITVIVGADQNCVASFLGGSGGTGSLSLELGAYNVAENAGSLSLKVLRTGETASIARVDYVLEAGTALLGQHYSASNGTLQWLPGESAAKSIPVLIVDDPVINEHRRFTVRLLNPSEGVELAIGEATISIINDDLLPDGIRCPSSGTIDTVCNAFGITLNNLTVTTNGHVANGTLSGTLQNHGWVSNLTVDAQGFLSGGIVTGAITNLGRMGDFEFHGTVLTGGSLFGNIVSVTGGIGNVRLEANTRISGGKLGGVIAGTAGAPAILQSLTVLAGTTLSHVLIGQEVIFEPGVNLAAGVRFPQGSPLPVGANLAAMLPLLNREACASGEIPQPPVYDLSQDVYYPSSGILSGINALPILQTLGLNVLEDARRGYLHATSPANARYLLQAVGVAFSVPPIAPMISGDDRQGVRFYTTGGVEVHGQPALEDVCQLQTALERFGLRLERVLASGDLRVVGDSGNFWYSARPEYFSQPADPRHPLGIFAPPSPIVGGTPLVYYVYLDRAGEKRLQRLFPAPLNAQALRSVIPGLAYEDYGVIKVPFNQRIFRFLPDYRVENGSPTGQMEALKIPDANGDGLADYRLTYPDGSRQVVYSLP